MRNVIKMIENGASYDEILTAVAKLKEESEQEAARAEKRAKVEAARRDIIEAVINYASVLGIAEDSDIENLDVEALEKEFIHLEKMIEKMPAMFKAKVETPRATIKIGDMDDLDKVLGQWIKDLQ